MIRALVLDFDGLILDTESPLYASWIEVYQSLGFNVSTEQWSSMLGTAADPPAAYEILEQHLGRPIDRDAVRAQRATREAELLAGEVPLPGVRELLAAAHERGLLLAVASSSDRLWVEGHLGRLGLLRFFHTLACADDVERTKPSPDLYLVATRRLGVAASEAIAFEDSPHGVDAAKRAGLYCVAVPNAVTRNADFARADLVVSSLRELALDSLIRRVEPAARQASG